MDSTMNDFIKWLAGRLMTKHGPRILAENIQHRPGMILMSYTPDEVTNLAGTFSTETGKVVEINEFRLVGSAVLDELKKVIASSSK